MRAGPRATSYVGQVREPTCEMSLYSLRRAGQMQGGPTSNVTPNFQLSITMH